MFRCYSAINANENLDSEDVGVFISYETARLRGLLLQCGLDCSIGGKDAGFELGVNLCPIDNDLEPTVVIRNQGQALNLLFIVGQYIFRQTDGFRLITSRCAIFNPNIHNCLLTCDPYHTGKSCSTKRATRCGLTLLS